MLLAVSRVNESVPLFLLEGAKRRLGTLADRQVAVLGLAFKADTDDERDSLAHKLIRLLERELADVAVHDPHVATPTASLEEAVTGADVVIVATNHSEFRDPRDARRDRRAGRAATASWWTRGTAGARRQVFAYASELAALGASRGEPGPRHRRRRHDRRRRREAPAGRPRLRGARLRPAPRAAVDARGLRGPHRRPARARGGAQAATARLHARRSTWPRSSAGSPTSTACPTRSRRSTTRSTTRSSGAALDAARSSASCTSPPRWCSSAPSCSRRPRTTCPRCPVPPLGVRLLEAHGRGLLPGGPRRARPPLHDLPPVQRLRPRRDARRRARDRPRGARPDQQGPLRPAPAADLRLGRADAHAHPRRRHRRRASSPR